MAGEEVAFAHLAQEGFDPRFTQADRDIYRGRAQPDAGVRAEQARMDAATHLVLVFPVYWWSLPALLKGWIDRTFIAGWAFDEDADGGIAPRLGHLTAHLLPVSGTSASAFARHGYTEALVTQIEHGIFDFCGLRRGATAFLHESESGDEAATAAELERASAAIAGRIAADLSA